MLENPKDWRPPKWHADFGDPAAELELLRDLAIAVTDRLAGLHCVLEPFEEGYMRVVMKDDRSTGRGEFCITEDSDGRKRFALFLDDGESELESYAYPVKEAVDRVVEFFIATHRTGERHR